MRKSARNGNASEDLSRTPAVVGSTPKVGEHNEEVLGGLLGYSSEEIAAWYANEVIGNPDHYDSLTG